MNKNSVLYEILPKMVETFSEEEQQEMAAEKGNAQTFGILNFIINLAFSASLNQLWSMINTQQIIVLIPLFKVMVPLNATKFLNVIMTVAAFDIIPTDDLYLTIFGLTDVDPPEALNSNFDKVGFETTWSFFNLGSMGLIIISFPLFVAVDVALRILDAFKIDKVGKWQK